MILPSLEQHSTSSHSPLYGVQIAGNTKTLGARLWNKFEVSRFLLCSLAFFVYT